METKIRHITEVKVEGKRLGRHVEHDPRSRDFNVTQFIDPTWPLISKHWKREAPVFDQGNLGSCTGNACLGHIGTLPDYAPDKGKIDFVEPTAVNLYSVATHLDGLGTPYPPNDRGSSTLGVLKAAKQLGYIDQYVWSFTFEDFIRALGHLGPCIIGVNWYSSFDSPSSTGLVKITPGASVRGGHEVEVYGVNVVEQRFYLYNSWGTSWGDHGRFHMSFHDMQRLLNEEGEVGIGMKNQ